MSNLEVTLWCWVIGDKPPSRRVFPVHISHESTIGVLKVEIKKQKQKAFDLIDADALDLYKISLAENDMDTELPIINVDSLNILRPKQQLSAVYSDPVMDLVVIKPPGMSGTDTNDDVSTTPNITYLIFTVPAHGNFGGRVNLQNNKILEIARPVEPDGLRAFRDMLGQRRWIKSDMVPFSPTNDPDMMALMGKFYEIHDDTEKWEGSENAGRLASSTELVHLWSTYKLKNCAFQNQNVKEADVRCIFGQLAMYFERLIGEKTYGFGTKWPFKLVAQVPVEGEEATNYSKSYTPHSDFSLFFRNEPYLLVEVQSDTNKSDLYRMLLQAACATRMRNALHRDDSDEKVPLVVTAMYITTDGKLERYFLFQSLSSPEKVHYTKDVFDLQQPQELVAAVFEMYNLASAIQRDIRALKNLQQQITDIDRYVDKEYKVKFAPTRKSTTDANMSSKPSRTSQRDDSGAGCLYDSRHVSEAFTQEGFMLESSDGWTPPNELPSTMRYAKHSDGTAVIVKFLRSKCSELSILEYLSSIDSPANHTIRLLRSFRLDVGTFIVVPEFTRLDIGLQFRQFRGKIASLGNQLIEGIAFMHCNGVAHLDIKPQNIVVRSDGRLFIIDFDLSLRVDGPDHLIDTWCGTPGWMAPEIGERDDRRRLYSPIRADLWSCGQVISYLMDKSNEAVGELKPFTRRLLHHNPQYRPLLSVHRQAKRKADTLASPRGKKKLSL